MLLIIRILALGLVIACFIYPLTLEAKVIAISILLLAFSGHFSLRRTARAAAAVSVISILSVLLLNIQSNSKPTTGDIQILPGGGVSLLNSLFAEEDGIFLMSALLSVIGGITANESNGLVDALRLSYKKMRAVEGRFPTPLFRTYLGLQNPTGFDLLSFKSRASKSAVIFLHGSGGNWSLLCFLFAESVATQEVATLCPSLGPKANWGSSAGHQILLRAIEEARKNGYERIYLAGLSSGAIGAAELAVDFEDQLAGVVLLFGNHPSAAKIKVPTLVVYSTEDERIPARWVAAIVSQQAAISDKVTEVSLSGDHFALLKKPQAVSRAIAIWFEFIEHSADPLRPLKR